MFTTFGEIPMTPFYAAIACLALVGCAAAPPRLPATQQQYQLVRSGSQGPFTLKQVEVPVPQPGAHQVLIRVHATSLNRRDIYVLHGQYPVGTRQSIVPVSDGAGEVVALGSGVSRFRLGDRVAGVFFQNWTSGRAPANVAQSALGGFIDGM